MSGFTSKRLLRAHLWNGLSYDEYMIGVNSSRGTSLSEDR